MASEPFADRANDEAEINLFRDTITRDEGHRDGWLPRYGFEDHEDSTPLIRATHEGPSNRHERDHDHETARHTSVEVAKASTSKAVEHEALPTSGLAANLGSQPLAASASSASMAAAAAPASAAVATGFPDDASTGVVAGTALKVFNGTYYVTQDNAVISNLEVHGDIVIEADNVTMKNIKLVSNTPWHALKILDDVKGFTLTDSEIDGGGDTVNAIYGHGTFLRNDLHDVENGINVTGAADIRDNFIHNLRGPSTAHFDGIENNGASNVNIIHNTIVNDHDQTSAVMLDTYFGSLSNIKVDNNWLEGGGYTVYLDGRFTGGTVDDKSISITNNHIGGGYWGNYAFYDDNPVVSGNVGLGTVVTPPPPTPTGTTYVGTAGDDSLPLAGKTNAGNETYQGLAGNDILLGGAGADKLDGGTGIDTASYTTSKAAVTVNLQTAAASGGDAAGDNLISIENLSGSSYNDSLVGSSGKNVLDGKAGADRISGGAGNDVILGGGGQDTIEGQNGTDTLTGGAAEDRFIFRESQIKTSGYDHITDFGSIDTILFDVASGSTGKIGASAFRLGTDALDSSDHFIFDASKDSLYYDSDGKGGASKVLIATFDNGFTPDATDFMLF
jgi:Ca2+-binding RTX toxin-like protein